MVHGDTDASSLEVIKDFNSIIVISCISRIWMIEKWISSANTQHTKLLFSWKLNWKLLYFVNLFCKDHFKCITLVKISVWFSVFRVTVKKKQNKGTFSVMVIVVGNRISDPTSNSGPGYSPFTIALIPLDKARIHQFSSKLMVNSRADSVF